MTEEAPIADQSRLDNAPYLSIVIPAYNEARRIRPTLARLQAYLRIQPYTWELVVVSNGSTDNTEEVVRETARDACSVQVVSLGNRGKGLAARVGGLYCRGEVVFLCDADLSMPPECLASFLDALQSADVVAGSREAPGAHRYREPWHRHVMGRVFNYLVQTLVFSGIHDTQCGFKAFRRCASEELFGRQTITGWGFDVELLFLARKLGYRIHELPIEWYFDADTRVRPGIDTLSMLWELIMIRIRDTLGRYGPANPVPVSGGHDVAR